MQNPKQKKHLFLSLHDKRKIIEAVNAGKTRNSIAKEYNVSIASVSILMKKHKETIDSNNLPLNELALKNRKVIKKVNNEQLEKAVLLWYNEKRESGETVTGPLICEKALAFNVCLNGPKEFKASNGWLNNFKKRNGIRNFSQQRIQENLEAATDYCLNFQNFIVDEDYNWSLVFNADESGIFWKNLPNNYDENSADERVTGLFCSNADGTFALPVLIIGKYPRPRCFKNLRYLPVVYKTESTSSMSSEIFLDWYKNHFILSVQEMQEKTQQHGKVLLLLDQAKCHPPKEILNSVNENFQVEFLPSNLESLVQPMSHVINCTKRKYRKKFVENLSLASGNIGVEQFIKAHNLKDCCFQIASAFQSLSQETLQNAWNKICAVSKLTDDNYDGEALDDETFWRIVQSVKGFENTQLSSIKTWLNSDNNDPGWKLYSDEEIIDIVRTGTYEIIETEEVNDEFLRQPMETDGQICQSTDFHKIHLNPSNETFESDEDNEFLEDRKFSTEFIISEENFNNKTMKNEENDDNNDREHFNESIESDDENFNKSMETDDDDDNKNFQNSIESNDEEDDQNFHLSIESDDCDESVNSADDENFNKLIDSDFNETNFCEMGKSKEIGGKFVETMELNYNFPPFESIEEAFKHVHNWCKQKKEYTEADYHCFLKWETLSRDAFKE
ncbi:jerky protein homolog-like [Leptopilina heterotoma]|uniref:jerky protein homolog-like n=1 Tax=Leptopilina heterotoma TaxID=63436 RepID=UPI001CA91358|nr:jerky protein homolog-like [Leptopilina heterotoma]